MPDHMLDPSAKPASHVSAPPEPAVDDAVSSGTSDEHLLDELLVEEVSIDGMCGVY